VTVLHDAAFAAVRAYLETEAGLVFDDSRRAGLSAVLAERLRATGAADVAAYLSALEGEAGRAERQRLLDGVTVRETHFFRNPPQIEALRRRVLPELLRRAAGRDRPLTIWSAGCSTGEEPYTLAMLLLELSPMLGKHVDVRIVGTDVSADALRVAARAVYSGRTLDPMPAAVRERWMEPGPGGSLVVADQPRRMVRLELHNLVTEPPPFARGEVDLVVCRNVTIYFGRETTTLLVGAFHDVLAEGGYLLLGHSETLWQVSNAFSLVPVGDAFVYRRSHDARRSAPMRRWPIRRGTPPPAVALPPARHPAPPRHKATETGAARRDPASDGADLLAAAQRALAEGDYAGAAARAADAVAADPLLASAYVVLGEARSTLGQDASAVAALRKAVYLDPAAGHAHLLLAGALSRLGQHGSASVSYRAAAGALAGMGADRTAGFLGGRDPRELAELCERLAAESAERAERADDAVPAPGGGR
jgi:chemotaxis protein methyltransferase CheR